MQTNEQTNQELTNDSFPPIGGDEPAQTPKQEPERQTPPPAKNLYRDFKSVDEIIRHAQSLEEQLDRASTPPRHEDQPRYQPQTIETPHEKSPGELLWEDPNKAFDVAVNNAVKMALGKFEAQTSKKEAQRQFWGDFYTKYPDLKGFEDDVNMVLNRIGAELAPLKPDAGMKLLADKVREKFKQILGRFSQGESMPDGDPVVMPASMTETPRQREPEVQVVGFVDQVTALRKRKSQ